MKKITFNIRTNEGKLEERQGYAVELPEYPDLRLACHRGEDWVVTELQTGGVFTHCNLRKDVVKTVLSRINDLGIDCIRDHIEFFLLKFECLGYEPTGANNGPVGVMLTGLFFRMFLV